MISKELLSNVLGINNLDYELSICETEIHYGRLDGSIESKFINIYELTNLCKEWAVKKGYFLTSKQAISHITKKLCYKVSIDPTEYHEYTLVGDTEPEAIFAACQYILDSK
jgi:hypothetical protein